VGKIRWPLRLQDEAAFHNYTHDRIQTALYDAFSSIFDVLSGTMPHPLTQLFDEYLEKKRKGLNSAHQRRTVTDERLAQDFAFRVPILPGDASLIEDFLADLDIQLHNETGATAHSLRLLHIGPILFSLVILRVYLDRPDENDHDIFHLVEQKRVSRVWTAHEQALAACHGDSNTSSNSPLAAPPTPLLYKIAVVNDSELTISDVEPLVIIKSLDSMDWTSRPGLSGGSRKPRRYKPPHLQPNTAGPRPKPRPAYGKRQVRFSLDGAVGESDKLTCPRRSKRSRVASEDKEAVKCDGGF
jgi:hypothetical protein